MLPDTNGSAGLGIVSHGRELLSTWQEALTGSVGDGTDGGESDAVAASAPANGTAVADPAPETVDADAEGDVGAGDVADRGETGTGGVGPALDDPSIGHVEREAYIESLLDENSGRLWQREIVSRTDVSSSTISRWLSAMEEEERIVRVRVGREKLVTLPEAGPEAATAPFEQVEE